MRDQIKTKTMLGEEWVKDQDHGRSTTSQDQHHGRSWVDQDPDHGSLRTSKEQDHVKSRTNQVFIKSQGWSETSKPFVVLDGDKTYSKWS